MREALLRLPDLTLSKCINKCHAAEQSKIQSGKIDGTNEESKEREDEINTASSTAKRTKIDCMFCENRHSKGVKHCPARTRNLLLVARKAIFRMLEPAKLNGMFQGI